jgi:zinc protease
MHAQELPLMPSDPSVSAGVLPNGMSYYLVENHTSKGLADFALVQKTGSETVPSGEHELPTKVAKDALAALPHLKSGSTQSYLARHGVVPGKNGFVRVSENATIFHFADMAVSSDNVALDSTLLVLFDIAGRGMAADDAFLKKWYSSADQAIVVSGDIQPAAIEQKLRLLSMMITAGKSEVRDDYVWQDTEEPVYECAPYYAKNLANVTATWISPRTPKEYMNTVQPAIFQMFVSELGIIAQERLKQRLRLENVPVAEVSYRHINTVKSLGDESFNVSVTVPSEYAELAVKALAEVMSSLDAGGTAVHELEMAKRRYAAMVRTRSNEVIRSNSEYVERCASAFLHNAPLSSDKEVLSFLMSRDIDIVTELKLFNAVVSALLDGKRNLTVECRAGGDSNMSSPYLEELFSSAWAKGTDHECKAPVDSIPFPAAGLKIKIKSAKREHMSGGEIWTFENGFRVVYKRHDTGQRLHYSLALNGGYGNIKDLSKGEGAYMTDYLKLCKVSGMSAEEFRQTLDAENMTLNQEVNISNTLISGSVPESKVELLMRVLLAVANESEPDPEAYEYYKICVDAKHEYLKGSVSDRIAAIDSVMCPDYIYSSIKTPGKLTAEFPSKANEFLKAQSEKMNDGLLVLVGNIEESRLRKLLQMYVGEFRTTDRSYPRTVVSYQPVSGASIYTVKGRENSADVAMSVRLSLTADNYMASNIASEILKRYVAEALEGTGTYIRLSHNCRIYPQERFNVFLTLEEASTDGFATGTELAGFDEALNRLRRALNDISSMEISDEVLSMYKEILKGHIALTSAGPEYWTHALAMRYLDGKDLTTGYAAKIDAVSAAKVKSILSQLTASTKVEYITRK